jgi:HEAT repeat protein
VTHWVLLSKSVLITLLSVFAGALIVALFGLIVYRAIDEIRFLRRQRLLARYRSVVDTLLTSSDGAAPIAELVATPARHRPVISHLLLAVARLQTGDAMPAIRAAAAALGLIDGWTADLSHRSWWVRAEGVRALGLMRELAAVPALLRALDEPHAEVRAAAADALGRMADPAIGPALLSRLRDESRYQRARLIEAIRAQGAPMMPALLGHARTDRANAATTLDVIGMIGDTSALGELLDWSSDPDATVRAAALRALGTIGVDDRSFYYALRGLEDADGDVRAMAARALGRSGRRDAVPYLAAHLDDQWLVAAHCATGLRRLGREGAAALQARAASPGQGADLANQMLWEIAFRREAA